jgi:aerobic carbon-monoxide dehydrogenase large subunit
MKFGIGHGIARVEDRRLVSGLGRYTDDLNLPGQARAYFLRSPHAHARILSIDARAARAMPGVVGVFTAKDVGDGLGPLPCRVAGMMALKRPDGAPFHYPRRAAMVGDVVRFVGDIVAMVVAETLNQARDAAERIEIDYEDLPAVSDPAAAMAPGAPAVWPEAPDNVSYLHKVGDGAAVAAALAKADHVVRFAWRNTRIAQNPMEPRAGVAQHDPVEDRYTLVAGTQGAHLFRGWMAEHVLRVPETRLRVISPDMGGGFGMRTNTYPEYALILWAAKRLGRPVKWNGDRSEAFLSDEHGRDGQMEVELGLAKDGTFLALRVVGRAAMGAYLSFFGPWPSFGNIGGIAGVYRTPLIAAEIYGVFTHTPPTGPYRGAGRPEATFCIERAIDLAAAKLGIDRFALRRRNMIPRIAAPYKTGLVFVYDCGDFPAVFERALKLADVSGFEARRRESNAKGLLRGLGLAYAIETAATFGDEHMEIRVDASGTLTLLAGSHNHGQGHETVFRQIIADRLGLDFADVRILQGDTDAVAHGGGTFGSRTSSIGSAALVRAADRVIEKARLIAAHKLEAAAADIEFKDGQFRVAGTDRVLAWKQVAKLAYTPPALPKGMDTGLAASATFTSPGPCFPNGCHVSEVEVDSETGIVRLDRYTVVDDVGTVLNPLLLKGQIQGGVVQGAGQVLLEAVAYDSDTGQILTGSFMDYCMPRADDMPMIGVESHPVPTAHNPLGAKGAGEAGTVGAVACVHSAVMDALAPLGIDWLDMPITPLRVWQAVAARRARKVA